jgi:ankyrin repeat protein
VFIKHGETPLIFAADRNHLDVTRILIENGADMSIRDAVSNMDESVWLCDVIDCCRVVTLRSIMRNQPKSKSISMNL